MAVNKCILLGFVGKDPEIRTMSNGNEVATFSLATTDVWKDKTTHERKEKTEWHRIVVYSPGLANIVKLYIKKGTKLYLEGSLQTRKWVGNDGIEKYTTEIILQGFNAVLQLLSSIEKEEKATTNEAVTAEDVKQEFESAEFVDEKIDDTIPF